MLGNKEKTLQQLAYLLANIRLNDVIDIALVSIIIYRFFVLIQGTRAYQMLVGILSLTALWWISSSYELYSLSWLLQNFFDYLFIIVIVLFQDQIPLPNHREHRVRPGYMPTV